MGLVNKGRGPRRARSSQCILAGRLRDLADFLSSALGIGVALRCHLHNHTVFIFATFPISTAFCSPRQQLIPVGRGCGIDSSRPKVLETLIRSLVTILSGHPIPLNSIGRGGRCTDTHLRITCSCQSVARRCSSSSARLTSVKYPTAYCALARPISAAFLAHKNASVSDWGSTPGDPTRYQAVSAKQPSR